MCVCVLGGGGGVGARYWLLNSPSRMMLCCGNIEDQIHRGDAAWLALIVPHGSTRFLSSSSSGEDHKDSCSYTSEGTCLQ